MSIRFALLLIVLSIVVAGCAAESVVVQGAARPVDSTTAAVAVTEPAASSSTTTTTTTEAPEIRVGLAAVPAGGAPIYAQTGGEPEYTIHEGILLGFDERDGNYLQVMTTCNDTMWVRERDVAVIGQSAGAGRPGNADIAKATIVIDPGHGDRDWGGVGPTGLAEKEANLDISLRLRTLLTTAHDVNWQSGAIAPGDTVPAVAAVWLTRDPTGPNGGDYELGLGYRSHIANSAGADAFVSIHNNTVPTTDTEGPGSEVFYAWSVDGSDRLASLIHQELLRSFEEFDVDWKGGLILGARTRIDPETDTDYYGILRRANMPAVIVEGAYISEPAEEELLRTDTFRQAYANAVYRGILRFLSTPEEGERINDPEVFTSDAGTVSSSACQVPRQPSG